MRKFFSAFSWGTKIFCQNFMGYEIFFGILEFHSAPVPGIITDQSLIQTKSGEVSFELLSEINDNITNDNTPIVFLCSL